MKYLWQIEEFMKNWTIGKRITAGFASVILISLALGIFSYTRLIIIRAQSDSMAKQAVPAIKLITQAQKNANASVQVVYRHVGSSDKADMAQLETSLVSFSNTKIFADVDKLITSEKYRELFEKVKNERTENSRIREQVLAFSRQGTNNAQAYDMARTQLDPTNERYIADLQTLADLFQADMDNMSAGVQSAAKTSQLGILFGLGFALFVGVSVAFIIIRGTGKILNQIAGSLHEGSSQVACAAGEVSAASQTLAEGSSEQASSLEETSSSLEEMSSMTKRNAENTQKANELAKEARSAADKGVGDMQTMATAMDDIKNSSDDIAKIIKTIDEIAFQTNILALNAAVEAARAGEAGMGFAVVADEVRNLAQRCAQAAKETSAKIEGAIAKSGQGVEITGKVAVALHDIVAKVRQVDELVTEIASASREQTDGINQINVAVSQMDKVTQSNAATAEESAASSEELNAQAETMKQSVAELLQLVGGSQAESGRNAPPAKESRRNRTSAKAVTSRNRIGNRNGSSHTATLSAPKARQGEIPMDGDFKDF
jgi:methyl-accepting chemotaxis protein